MSEEKVGVKTGEIVRVVDEMTASLMETPLDSATQERLQRAEIDQQITTARSFPRSLEKFRSSMMAMATIDQETAESMYYQLPRDGKLIEGPSARLAEIAACCWGNVRFGSRVSATEQDSIVGQGQVHDLERNTVVQIEVRRRIVNKHGRRFSADMIHTTGLAAQSIALRNAIFKVVPLAFIKPILAQAKRVAAGDEKTLTARRDAALLYFKGLGVKQEQVFELLGVKGKEDINLEHLGQLAGVRTAIKDGEAKLEDIFAAKQMAELPVVVSTETLSGAAVKVEESAKHGAPEQKAAAVEPPKTQTEEDSLAAAAAKLFE